MAIKGSLKEASLADVCQLLALGGKTGCLSITDRANFGQIYFDRGRVTYARIVNRRDRLGDLLVREGVLSRAQLDEGIEAQARSPDEPLGQILVRHGYLDPVKLEQVIRRQIEEAVYYLFTWSRGSFFFEAGKQPEDTDILVSINPENLLLEGARRVDEWSLIEQRITSLDLIFRVDRERVQLSGVDITSEQKRVLPLLDGSLSLREIAERTGLVEFDVGKAVYGLLQAGFAHQVGRRETELPPRLREAEVGEHRNLGVAFYQTGIMKDAAREFDKVLELDPTNLAARFYLGLIALRVRDYAEAARRFGAILEGSGARYEALLNMGYALAQLHETDDALSVLAEAEELRPRAPQPALLRAAVLLEAGRLEDAESALGEYRTRIGGAAPTPAYYHYRALSAAVAGRLEDAEAVLRAGLATAGESPPLLLLASAIAERRGDHDQAQAHARRAAESDTNLPQAHKQLGDHAYRRGLHDEAIEHYERALQLAPDLGDDIYTKLGNIHFKRNERDRAMERWRRALELNPANRVVRSNLEVATHAGD
ncbi:MAG: DUF4388 domain-containing protein [Longimicrobiales bacterium]